MKDQKEFLRFPDRIEAHDGNQHKVCVNLLKEPLRLKNERRTPWTAAGCGVHPLVEEGQVLAPLWGQVPGISDVDGRKPKCAGDHTDSHHHGGGMFSTPAQK